MRTIEAEGSISSLKALYIGGIQSLSRFWRPPNLAVFGVCFYILTSSLAIRVGWDLSLFVLSLCGIAIVVQWEKTKSPFASPLIGPALWFLLSIALSIIFSSNLTRSLRLSATLLPAYLIFLLITEQFVSLTDVLDLYSTLSLVSLGLSTVLLWTASKNPWMKPDEWVSAAGNPTVLVPNDIAMLAIIAPLNLSILYFRANRWQRLLPLLALVSTVGVVGIYQSRGAVVLMVVSFCFFFGIRRPKFGIACGFLLCLVVFVIDAISGFPLLGKVFSRVTWTQRLPLWSAAINMFADAPLFGHGPHTFAPLYRSYLQGVHLPDWVITDPRFTPWPHNLLLEMLAEQGLAGFTSLLFLIAMGLRLGWKSYQRSENRARVLVTGVLASFVSFCVAAIYELSFLRHWAVILLFTLLGAISCLSSLSDKNEVRSNAQLSSI